MFSKAETLGVQGFLLLFYLALLGLSRGRQGFQDLCCLSWDFVFWHVGSVSVLRLSCSMACGTLILLPGTELVSLVLQGEFLTSEPPGKSQEFRFFESGLPIPCLALQ